MRDLGKTLDYIEHTLLRGLDRKATPSPNRNAPRPSIRAWRAPPVTTASNAAVVYPVEQVFRPKNKPAQDTLKPTSRDTPKDSPKSTSRNPTMTTRLTVTTKALKITVPLDAAEVRALPDPGSQARCLLAIACEGKIYTADIATKALRKAKSTISANGADNVFCMAQGKLKGNEIIECGLVAQVKTPKPAAAEVVVAKPAEAKATVVDTVKATVSA
jgi:hypothetical protein